MRAMKDWMKYCLVSLTVVGWAFAAVVFSGAVLASTKAFPTAEGFGADSVGGRGGQVIEVTNLNDSGPGSLRAAIEASGPRIVVFRTGGVIQVDSEMEISNPFITIAGQTAPGDGITLVNRDNTDSLFVVLAPDVIIRHLHLRPGPGGNADGIGVGYENAYNVIVDHCSVSWGVDENMSTYSPSSAEEGMHNVTYQWNIASEALDCSTHDKGCHSKGLLIGKYNTHSVSVHHNLLAHNVERNPRISVEGGVVDVVNNVIYNPGFNPGSWGPAHVGERGLPMRVNFVGNYYKPGVDSATADYFISSESVNEIYVEGNVVPHDIIRPSDAGTLVSTRHPAQAVTTTSGEQAYDDVLAQAGATMGLNCDGSPYFRRDPIDERVINDVKNGTGSHIDDPSEVGGLPFVDPGIPCEDTDHDGMPDLWENLNGLNLADPSDGPADADGDGYTNVEEYLNADLNADTTPPTAPTGLVIRGLAP